MDSPCANPYCQERGSIVIQAFGHTCFDSEGQVLMMCKECQEAFFDK